MELEDQICSLELSKRLKKFGVKQESLMYFIDMNNAVNIVFKPLLTDGFLDKFDYSIIYSAFTVAELLELLPHMIFTLENSPFNSYRLKIEKSFYVEPYEITKNIIYKEDMYIVNYFCDSTEIEGENAWMQRRLTKNMHDKNPANALALMLIYLLENGLIKNA